MKSSKFIKSINFSNVPDEFSYKYHKTYKYANVGMVIIIDDLKYYKVLDTCIDYDTGEKMLLILVCIKDTPECDHINGNINSYKTIMSYNTFEKMCFINKKAYYQTFSNISSVCKNGCKVKEKMTIL
jgi:hypothetical protein